MSVSNEVKDYLESEIGKFQTLFPRLDVRFCRIMGRRISHLAGDTSEIRTDELRLPVGLNLLMFVSGAWAGQENDLRKYAVSLGKLLDYSLQDNPAE